MSINDKPIKVEGKEGRKYAPSAETATAEIEEHARRLDKVDNTTANIISKFKDPKSPFITAEDLMREQRLLSLGYNMEVSLKGKKSKIMTNNQDRTKLKSLITENRVTQGCPVCSLELMNRFPMEWIESVEMWRCVRCTMEVHPFSQEDEPIPEESTNFGLSAIHDIGGGTNKPDMRTEKPIVYSKKRKKDGPFEELEKRKTDYEVEKKLGRKFS